MITLIALGKIKDKNLEELYKEYEKRLSKFTNFKLVELKDEKIDSKSGKQIKELEAKKIIQELSKKDSYIIALDEIGKEYASQEFAKKLRQIEQNNKNITFIIGGALGLDKEILKIANKKIALSKMTFTHKMARVFFIEQIYRAYTINNGINYHK